MYPEVAYNPIVPGHEFNLASHIVHVFGEQLVGLWCIESAEYDSLPQVSRMAVKVPVPNSTEVASSSFLWLQVETLKDVLDMLPILHEQSIGVIDDDDFD